MGRFARHLPRLLLLFLLTSLSGCAGFQTRVVKQLLPQDFVFAMDPATPPAVVTYKTGYSGALPEAYQRPRTEAPDNLLTRPPIVTRDGWIEVTPQRTPVQVRVYLRNVEIDEGEFFEVKSITGNIPRRIPSEVRFLDDVAQTTQPVRIVLRNLKNPYNGYTLRDGALLLVEVIDPALPKVWRYLFLYKDFGSRQKLSFNIVLNITPFLTDVGVPLHTTPVGNAAFTMSYSFGYRFRTQNDVLRWLGDKVALVALLGTSTNLSFGDGLFNQLSIGVGVEYYDFLSTNLLMDTSAIGNLSNGQWGIVVGFDAVRAADFTRKLTRKLFDSNRLK